MEACSDNHLMLKVRDGDVEKLGVLFQRYRTLLLNFFLRYTRNHAASEDLVQDVFVRILKYRHSFGQESEFAAWMYRIARNTHLNQCRKLGRETHREENCGVCEIPSEDPGPDEILERTQKVKLLYQALEGLPQEKRELLLLSRIQKLKYSQIAERLRCDVGTVKVRVFRATLEMKKKFQQLSKERAFPSVASLGSLSPATEGRS